MSSEERSQTARSPGHGASSRLAWVLVALLGTLLLVTLKPSLPLEVSIAWKPGLPGSAISPDRADRSASPRTGNAVNLERDEETDILSMEKSRVRSGQRRRGTDAAASAVPNERSLSEDWQPEHENNWSDVDGPQGRSGSRRLRRVPNAVANLATTRAAGTMPTTIATMNGASALRDHPRPRPVIRSVMPTAGGTTPPEAWLRGPPRNPAACRIPRTAGRRRKPDVSRSPEPYRT